MANDNILDESTIGDIILCDPITSSGKQALINIGLTTKDVSQSFFYEKLRVESKYGELREYTENVHAEQGLYYQYTMDSVQFRSIREMMKQFETRFCSDSPNEYPLLMLGVAGNGKSIEANRRIREVASSKNGNECGSIYLDLEQAFSRVTYGDTFSCPSYTPLWLFCAKLLDSIMRYIKQCYLLCPQILNNFNNIIVKQNLANERQIQIFQYIGAYRLGDNISETAVFRALKSLLSLQEAARDIQNLLEILMWIMYCATPNEKHYIVIDNIEQYILLNNAKIQIPNRDITTIYRAINEVVTNVVNDFNRVEQDLGWKAFKIIIVLRRTSIGLLDSTLLQSPVRAEKNITDVTGYFQISDIWKNKKQYVWKEKLSDKHQNSKNDDLIKIVDLVMDDGIQAVGMDYQSIIAPLMSYGIRRNARSQAHSTYKTYEILSNNDNTTIGLDEFYQLLDASSSVNNAVRYMFRRALLEFQFKWSIAEGNSDRWKKLGIGHLVQEKTIHYGGTTIVTNTVEYVNPQCVTLMRRILTHLSWFVDENNRTASGQSKSVVEMFSTISLFDLIKGVLINPLGHNEISKDDFQQLSRVLMALSDMSNGDTRSAPYVILGVNDDRYHADADNATLADILEKIWKAGPEKSLPGKQYNCSDYGARITDAGNSFLLDWQASFSLMASLYCFSVPPLFFLKSVPSIKYVIETVYNESANLCRKYENEATSFCGVDVTLKTGKYLLQHNGKYITFKQRVKELHSNHLRLYKSFVENNHRILGFSNREKQSLSGFIERYISKYDGWNTDKGAPECF